MKRILISILIIAAIFTGCHQKGTAGDTKLLEPFRIAAVNIPLADHLNTSQFDRVAELETDDYGRRYFGYKTYSGMLSSNIEIHIISQKTEEDQVFYYPDFCYMVRIEDSTGFTEENILHLKSCNDWNQPLAEDKMYAVSYSQFHTGIASLDGIDSAIRSYLDFDDSYGILYNGLEILNKNEQIYFVAVFPRDEDSNTFNARKFYLVIYNDGLYRPITACQEITDPLSCQNQIHQFRQYSPSS